MKLRAMLLLFTTIYFSVSFSQTDTQLFLTVPFQNITLNPNQQLAAPYTIGNHKIIFCFENNQQTVGIVNWPYRGAQYQSNMPIFLKTDPNFEGQFADNSGTIVIRNNQSHTLYVSCLFGF